MNQKKRQPQPPLEEIDPAMPLGLWTTRFGAPQDAFADHRFWQRSASTLWIAHKDVEPPPNINPECIGLAFLRLRNRFPKPTTSSVRRFGHLATRNVVSLNHTQTMDFLRRKRFAFPLPPTCQQGYVLARHNNLWLGCGLWLEGHLSSQIARQHALSEAPPMTRIQNQKT